MLKYLVNVIVLILYANEMSLPHITYQLEDISAITTLLHINSKDFIFLTNYFNKQNCVEN